MLQMNTKHIIPKIILLIIFLMVTSFFPAIQNQVIGGDINLGSSMHKVILTHSPEGISPNPFRIKKGDTIVWFNQDKEPVVIKFIPEIGIVCSPIINFYADLSGFYKTGSILKGGTASLCFIHSGEYEYEVIRLVAKPKGKPIEQILQGKVIVD